MQPIHDLKRISQLEEKTEGQHVIALFLIKPSDEGADSFLKSINYFHHRAGRYCSLYALGYSDSPDEACRDVKSIPNAVDNRDWYYSDACFIRTMEALGRRLKNWRYTGTPEMIILQNNPEGSSALCFAPYYRIDLFYGLKKGYIDDFNRFMERFIQACVAQIDAQSAVKAMEMRRLQPRRILVETIGACEKLPKPVRSVLGDTAFIRTCRG